MTTDFSLLKAPQLGTNENTATLVEWSIDDQTKVDIGDIICTLETTKSTFDVETQFSGYVLQLVEIGSELSIGDNLAIIGPNLKKLEKEKNNLIKGRQESSINSNENSYKATKKAERLAKELKINLVNINVKGIIKENDVLAFAEEKGISIDKRNNYLVNSQIAKKIKLIGNRKTAKDLMLYSKSNIPHSYVEQTINIEHWLNKIEAYIKNEEKYITVLSLIICALGKAINKYENFNSYRKENYLYVYKNVNVGVVVSLEDSLSVPVLKDVDKLKPEEITQTLMRIRKALLKRKSNPDDFIGGTITISSMEHTDVTRFVPIIHPNQSAVIALPKIINRVDLDDNGGIIKHKSLNIGISFDHSFLDANQANNFLIELITQTNLIIDQI